MPEIKALLFDLDGLMADSEKLHLIGQNMLVSTYCGRDTELTEEDLKHVVGSSDYETCRYLKQAYRLEPSIDDLVKIRIEFVRQAIEKHGLDKMPGIDRAIAYAEARGWRLAVVSASPAALVYPMLEEMDYRVDDFDVVLDGDSVKRCKPDPEIYLKAAAILEVEPENCIALEDSYFGMISAIRAGMYCIVAPNEFSKYADLSGASRIVSSITEAVQNHFFLSEHTII